MRTSELAARAGVNPQTLRYYERRGLLPPPARTPSGYREFDEAAVSRMQFIKRAQSVGFSLAEVETLLHLSAGQPTDCHGARELATVKISELDQRIRDLRSVRRLLDRFVEQCDEATEPGHCPMLAELSEDQSTAVPR
jgi:Hg(II)-responsive transcriptional regulator